MSSCPTTRYCHSYVICQQQSSAGGRFWLAACSTSPGDLVRNFGVIEETCRQRTVNWRRLCDNFRIIYVRTQSLLRKIKTGVTGSSRASVRQRLGEKDLRERLATGVGPVDGALQDVAERISAEPGAQTGSGSDREANGAVFLRRRRRASCRIRSSHALTIAAGKVDGRAIWRRPASSAGSY